MLSFQAVWSEGGVTKMSVNDKGGSAVTRKATTERGAGGDQRRMEGRRRAMCKGLE